MSEPRTCKLCQKEIENCAIVKGKKKYFYRRSYCLECSPFGAHNTSKDLSELSGVKICPNCKITLDLKEFYRRSKRGGKICSWCIKCTKNFQCEKRRVARLSYIKYKGGKCQYCGYNESISVFEFHHLDPTEKKFSIASRPGKEETIRKELDKCVLVCANCHRRIEAGEIQLNLV